MNIIDAPYILPALRRFIRVERLPIDINDGEDIVSFGRRLAHDGLYPSCEQYFLAGVVWNIGGTISVMFIHPDVPGASVKELAPEVTCKRAIVMTPDRSYGGKVIKAMPADTTFITHERFRIDPLSGPDFGEFDIMTPAQVRGLEATYRIKSENLHVIKTTDPVASRLRAKHGQFIRHTVVRHPAGFATDVRRVVSSSHIAP